MKFLLKQLEKSKHLFEPDGKLDKLYPLYEANDTFLFTPSDVTDGPSHIRDSVDMKRTMITVILALIPCILFGIWKAGHQYNLVNLVANPTWWTDMMQGATIVLPIILVSYAVGGIWEVLFSVIRKHEINEGFLVTGMLFPLTLPPTVPLWQVAIGISFGVVIGKEIFGGTGFNVLNPALTARAFLFFAYPVQMSGDNVWTVVHDKANVMEGFTGATPLAIAALSPTGGHVVQTLTEAGFSWKTLALGTLGGSIGESSFIACALGALILILAGIGSWQIMLSCVIGLFAGSSVLNWLPADQFSGYTQLPFHYHVVMGGFAFGAVYMATDPVSAAATRFGKWIYGFLIGFLVILIRVTNPAYPEGVMVAILFMNVMAPLIDHYVLQFHIKQRAAYLRKFSHA
ncbi:MAG: NADH:ubiquinone reductase (Na(+)-transporting) subunit B [Kiritimatiellae bacterium]|nr:NADH:ubiquinone reductase (Na(+)-transporting) subunit B [Kiritimatiellia bacterium]